MKEKNYTSLIIFFIFLFVFFYYFTTLNTNIMSVVIMGNDGKIIHSQSLDIPNEVLLTQSVFNAGKDFPYFMQSSAPITEDGSSMILRAVVKNPFDDQAKLIQSVIYKNGNIIGGEKFVSLLIQKGGEYIYKTDEIDLKGNDAEINKITIDFLFEDNNGNRKTVKFAYNYLSLTLCNRDGDCNPPKSVCDLGNQAKFSDKSNEFFCAKTCVAHQQCSENQICIKGVCGY